MYGTEIESIRVYGPCRDLRSKATEDLLEILRTGDLTGDTLPDWKNYRRHIAQRDEGVAEGFTTAGIIGGLISDRPPVADIVKDIIRHAAELLSRAQSLVSTVVAVHVGLPVDDVRRNFVAAGRYLDRFERRDGEWRIIHRHAVGEWFTPSTARPVRRESSR